MKSVLVTGGNGQLAQCIKDLSADMVGFTFTFVDIQELDITNKDQISDFFKHYSFSYCVNCAAYTAVDRAETEFDLAFNINSLGAENLAIICSKYNTTLIHISTDFVFDGEQKTAYTEGEVAKPISIYGQSKFNGELAVIKNLNRYYIIRTSWLYSEYGHNFLKTMLRLAEDRDEISVVNDQFGSPTYARDLAKVILQIIINGLENFGVYHYSNEGIATWHEFAKSIFQMTNKEVHLKPISTKEYPTPAKRPKFSVLDKTKLKAVLNIKIPHWQDSLKECLKRIN